MQAGTALVRVAVLALFCAFFATAALAELKRPYEVPRLQSEIGSFLVYQKSLAGLVEMGTYTPIKLTMFQSDVLDLKFEGGIGYFWRSGGSWRSFTAGTGFRYWIDSRTNVTPFVRLGFARAQTGSRPFFTYGADVMLQRIFTLNPKAGHEAHRFIVAETQAGFVTHHLWGTGIATRQGFVISTAAYDWPIWQSSWNARHRKRAKLGVGFETRFGGGSAMEWLFLAAASFRSEHPQTGQLIHKIDLTGALGLQGQHRVSVGFTYGF